MAGPSITHTTPSGSGSGAGGTIAASEWNATHTISGLWLTSGFVGGPTSGRYLANRVGNTSTTAQAMSANDMTLAPFIAPFGFTADRISTRSGATVAGTMKLLIYNSGTDGWPSTLVLETAALTMVSGTVIEATCSVAMAAGGLYWVGCRASAGTNITAAYQPGTLMSSNTNNTSSSVFFCLSRSLTYATAATDPFAFTSTDISGNAAPLVSLRMA